MVTQAMEALWTSCWRSVFPHAGWQSVFIIFTSFELWTGMIVTSLPLKNEFALLVFLGLFISWFLQRSMKLGYHLLYWPYHMELENDANVRARELYIFPANKTLATVAVDVSHCMLASGHHPILLRPNWYIHPVIQHTSHLHAQVNCPCQGPNLLSRMPTKKTVIDKLPKNHPSTNLVLQQTVILSQTVILKVNYFQQLWRQNGRIKNCNMI